MRLVPMPLERTVDAAASTDAAPSMAELYRDHAAYVARVAHALLGRDDEVDDVVQEAFVDAMRALPQLRDPAAARGWLRVITVRRARGKLKARRLRGWLGIDDAPGYDEVAAAGASPEDRALLARVYAILDELPTSDRLAWSLRHVEGERLEEVAHLCGCSLATAKRRIDAAEKFIAEKTR